MLSASRFTKLSANSWASPSLAANISNMTPRKGYTQGEIGMQSTDASHGCLEQGEVHRRLLLSRLRRSVKVNSQTSQHSPVLRSAVRLFTGKSITLISTKTNTQYRPFRLPTAPPPCWMPCFVGLSSLDGRGLELSRPPMELII